MSLAIDLALGDTLLIGEGTRIRLERKTGQRARLLIDGQDVVNRIKAGDKVPAAARAGKTGPGTEDLPQESQRSLVTKRTPSV